MILFLLFMLWLGICFYILFTAYTWTGLLGGIAIVTALCYGCGSAYVHSDGFRDYQAANRAEAAREQARAKAALVPRVISTTNDGCPVYSFEADGLPHYFTRCGADKVTTDSTYTVAYRCGKATCTRNETETITTNGEAQ